MFDTTNTEKQEKKIWRSPLAALLFLAIFVLGGLYTYNVYSRQKVLIDLGYKTGLQSENSFLAKCIGDKAEPTTPMSFYEITQKRLEQNDSIGNVDQDKPGSFTLGGVSKEYYGYDCFDNFLGDKIFRDRYPGGLKLEDQTAKSALVDKYVNYCINLPDKFVNPAILHDQAFVPGLSYSQFCIFILTDNFTAAGNEKFTLSINEFVEKFPKWQKPERAEYGILKDERGFRTDVSKYLCGKAYKAEESSTRSKCENPRIDEFYEVLGR